MGKVHKTGSAESSHTRIEERPRSLKFYLKTGLHHRVIGRFATVAFYSKKDKILKNVSYSTDTVKREDSVEENNSKSTDKSQESRSKEKTESEISTSKEDNISSKVSTEAPSYSKIKDKTDEKKIATASTYTTPAEPGPFANFEKTRKDSSLVWQKVKLSKEVLATAKTVFPIDPFPDTVVLDRTTLSITKRTFFLSNDTLSIRIEDILNAEVNVGPFLGSLTIASRVLSSKDHFTISNLWRKDAIHLKHMIQGYIIALHNEIDLSHLSKKELIETISELGHDLNS